MGVRDDTTHHDEYTVNLPDLGQALKSLEAYFHGDRVTTCIYIFIYLYRGRMRSTVGNGE